MQNAPRASARRDRGRRTVDVHSRRVLGWQLAPTCAPRWSATRCGWPSAPARARVWRTRSQLELAIVEYLGWFKHERVHESLGDIPPAQFEALYAPRFLSEVHA